MWVVTGCAPFAGKEAVAGLLPDIGSRPWIAPVAHMPLFFATVLLSMENIGTVSIFFQNYSQSGPDFASSDVSGLVLGASDRKLDESTATISLGMAVRRVVRRYDPRGRPVRDHRLSRLFAFR